MAASPGNPLFNKSRNQNIVIPSEARNLLLSSL